ncbi:hypothetical protein BV22DRAFT_135355 [Leucogyrophana mollusca]|uniref:Uncharacterized protein n=1 Tax=Leucogyrophana mollusca TaxID=85980 RepID=A0ACB8BX26_9AGAM|nr:hypothetical protein BV22DRAFT_135355 [Leucogyrophana mollusca]
MVSTRASSRREAAAAGDALVVAQSSSTPSINTMPTELLLMIFKGVYAAHRTGQVGSQSDPNSNSDSDSDSDSDSSDDWIPADPLSPSYFPLALTRVCTAWRDIMSTVPEFWTRLVIFVDNDPTPLSQVESWLEWSRDLPLDILVTRRPDRFEEDDPDENDRVDCLIDVIYGDIERCQRLCFDVILASSLPPLDIFNHLVAPHLATFTLECRVDDGPRPDVMPALLARLLREEIVASSTLGGGIDSLLDNAEPSASVDGPSITSDVLSNQDEENSEEDSDSGSSDDESDDWDSDDWDFEIPNINSLVLDGRNFCNAFLDPCEFLGWKGHLDVNTLQRLKIAHYKPTEGERKLSLYDLLAALSEEAYHLGSLEIEDIDFQEWRLDEVFYIRQKCLYELSITDIKSELAVAELFRISVFSIDTIRITRCPINSLRLIPDQCTTEEFYFEEIDENQDFRRPLRNWDGSVLVFDKCPGFNDRFLAQMSREPWICKDVAELNINNCPNFTVRALKKMMKKRRDTAALDGQWGADENLRWKDFSAVRPITSLCVHGGPLLSAKDEAWFLDIMKSRGSSFHWTTEAVKEKSKLLF